MGSPQISIIIPVYNAEKYIHRCIDSVISQTFTDFECILIDDCSSDGSPKICDDYAKRDKRIKVIHKTHNEGSSLARKIGLENSTSEYVMYIDSDDWIDNDMLEKLYSQAVSQDYDIVYCDYYFHDILGDTEYKKMPHLTDDFVNNIRLSVLGKDGSMVWNKLVKRGIYEKIIFPKSSYAEDRYITAQVFFYSRKITYVNFAPYHYHCNKFSLEQNPKFMRKRYLESKNNFGELFDFLKKTTDNYPSAFEPELSKRMEWIRGKNPLLVKNILRSVIPIKIRKCLIIRARAIKYFLRGCSKSLWHNNLI